MRKYYVSKQTAARIAAHLDISIEEICKQYRFTIYEDIDLQLIIDNVNEKLKMMDGGDT